jgi:hypothetical protein
MERKRKNKWNAGTANVSARKREGADGRLARHSIERCARVDCARALMGECCARSRFWKLRDGDHRIIEPDRSAFG